LRIVIGALAVLFIYFRLKDAFLLNFQLIDSITIEYTYLLLVVLLLFFNWGLEALKWKFAIRSIHTITFITAFKSVLTGVTLGFLTPNRIGEIPGRSLLLGKHNFKATTLKTAVASFSQLLITLFFGLFGFFYSSIYFIYIPYIHLIIFILFGGFIFLLLIFFFLNKFEFIFNKISYVKDKALLKGLSGFTKIELFFLIFFSFLRFIVFSVQYYFVLLAFSISLNSLTEIFLIPICFLITSFIPTLLISEIGLRGSVALFVFGMVTDQDVSIILASIVLWVINVAFPALLGLFNLKELKLFREF
jgi:uncharacterized membrane protein YbhN (UPF0104 family)